MKIDILKNLALTNPIVGTTLVENSFQKEYYIILKKEKIMVEVTEVATKQIAEYFKGKEVSPIRIFLNSGG
jgi:acetamidase/formamidase